MNRIDQLEFWDLALWSRMGKRGERVILPFADKVFDTMKRLWNMNSDQITAIMGEAVFPQISTENQHD